MVLMVTKHASASSGSALAAMCCLVLAGIGNSLQGPTQSFNYMSSTGWLSSGLMVYDKEINLLVCAPGKTGSTSLFSYLYSSILGKAWDSTDTYVQDVTSSLWKHQFELIFRPDEQEQVMTDEKAFKYALIRDPKERLVSAWKSKLACEAETYKTNKAYRPRIMDNLRNVLGAAYVGSGDKDCLTLHAFLQNLKKVHEMGRQQDLDFHIIPQDLACFQRYAPGSWSVATEIDAPGALTKLAERLGTANSAPPRKHSSGGAVQISNMAAELLDYVTRDEYAVLNDFLTRRSKVKAGASVLVSA